MQKKFSQKHIFICLLLCSLFISSYTGLLNANGLTPADLFSGSSISDNSSLSSMNGGMLAGHTDLFTATESLIESFSISMLQSRWMPAKSYSPVLAAIAALMICLIFASRLTHSISTPFNALSITIFLHEKDGMK